MKTKCKDCVFKRTKKGIFGPIPICTKLRCGLTKEDLDGTGWEESSEECINFQHKTPQFIKNWKKNLEKK